MSQQDVLLHGLVAAPFTPFAIDGSLQVEVIDEFSKYLKSIGVTGVFICGTTGEYASMTVIERQQVAEAWLPACRRDGLRMVVHVGDNCLANAQALAVHSREVGVDGIAMVLPTYFKPASIDEAVAFMGRVAESGGDLPLYYYEIPGLTGIQLGTTDLAVQAMNKIPSFAGVKYSSMDLIELQRLIATVGDRLNILFGCDEVLMTAQGLGIDGAVGSTYNYAAPVYQRMVAAFERGDFAAARELQGRSVQLVAALNQVSPLSAGKALLKRVGFDFGPVRLPLRALSAEEETSLNRAVDQCGIFDA